jgi:hypothetical protein
MPKILNDCGTIISINTNSIPLKNPNILKQVDIYNPVAIPFNDIIE